MEVPSPSRFILKMVNQHFFIVIRKETLAEQILLSNSWMYTVLPIVHVIALKCVNLDEFN